MLDHEPFRWNPNHWTRRRAWSEPERPDHENCILVRDDGREMLYDPSTGTVSMADTYNPAARQMARGEVLASLDTGLSLGEARSRVRSILDRDIPAEETRRGRREARAFVEAVM
jgi:hypothetical protein